MIYLIIYIIIGWSSAFWIESSFMVNYKLKHHKLYKHSQFSVIASFICYTLLGVFALPLYLLITDNKGLFKLRL